jgi:tRNA threonylcarbamoyladenosine biosynthesis protein TsaE
MLIPLPSLRSTRSLARRVARDLSGRELLLLSGELGAGKTTFVGLLARELGIEPGWVSSPSFTLVQRYPAGARGIGIVHVDLYRLRSAREMEGLGLEETLASSDLVVVEWPELGEELWASSGRPALRLAFGFDPEGRRQLEWSEL